MSEPSKDTTEPLPPSCDPASKLSDETLVQLLLESYARSFMYPESETQHNRWVECKAEVLSRLRALTLPSNASANIWLPGAEPTDKGKEYAELFIASRYGEWPGSGNNRRDLALMFDAAYAAGFLWGQNQGARGADGL